MLSALPIRMALTSRRLQTPLLTQKIEKKTPSARVHLHMR